jgi:sialate O-acetylesterase
MRDALDVPFGIILIAVPGTNQAAWMSKETLEKFPGANGKNYYQEFLAGSEAKVAKGNGPKTIAEYQGADERTQSRYLLPFADFPAALYNTRLYPLAPLAIRGVMWHQGEAGPGGPYGERLVAMVKQWRELFGQDFYFIWGTLGRNTSEAPPLSPMRSGFYRSYNNVGIRKALELFGSSPDAKATLVEFYDNGNNVTHWLEKAESGRRMGLAALTEVYGQKHIYTGPRAAKTKIDGAKATTWFANVGDGLVYEPSIQGINGGGISGVYLRGKDGTVRWGNVKVVGKDAIEVSHPDIKDVETLAYGDNPNPHVTLIKTAGGRSCRRRRSWSTRWRRGIPSRR